MRTNVANTMCMQIYCNSGYIGLHSNTQTCNVEIKTVWVQNNVRSDMSTFLTDLFVFGHQRH